MIQTIVVFDTETTGLPPRPSRFKRYPDPRTEYERYANARVVELAYIVYMYNTETKEYTRVQSNACLVSPNGEFVIMNESIHGITQNMANRYGKPIKEVLIDFRTAVSKSDVLVAHNIEFDMNIIQAEFYRAGLDPMEVLTVPKTCTLHRAMCVLNLTRYPKLNDLYNRLYPLHSNWIQSHRALDDTEKCALSYFALFDLMHG